MKGIFATTCLLVLITSTLSFAQTTYTSTGSTAWNLTTSWSPVGVPGRTDHVVILIGHTISISAVTDNDPAGVSADGLSRSNVGAFDESGTVNFYHTGDITVNTGGALTSTARMMHEGTTVVDGSFTISADLINLGKLVVSSAAILTIGDDDDLILTAASKTIIDKNQVDIADDLSIDHTEATLWALV